MCCLLQNIFVIVDVSSTFIEGGVGRMCGKGFHPGCSEFSRGIRSSGQQIGKSVSARHAGHMDQQQCIDLETIEKVAMVKRKM